MQDAACQCDYISRYELVPRHSQTCEDGNVFEKTKGHVSRHCWLCRESVFLRNWPFYTLHLHHYEQVRGMPVLIAP